MAGPMELEITTEEDRDQFIRCMNSAISKARTINAPLVGYSTPEFDTEEIKSPASNSKSGSPGPLDLSLINETQRWGPSTPKAVENTSLRRAKPSMESLYGLQDSPSVSPSKKKPASPTGPYG